ncbi:MAG: haloalkane dehalogenase [Deltaproteobacteria bacterium]|nr:haloalkane dehalogenase [Deltaproteobacteria bacterium]MCB9478664.1 haloalkane dehalogenase [Deltaproteobacteria bacterium]MCB9489806.1 haloalkane dehalogenase [Deltaproteobacteria bacterium]
MEDGKPISPDFPFESKFVEVHGSKMHYVEQGAGDPVLFLHGNPTSSYLWRNILPYAAEHGRAIAVDLIGMGKSDKPEIEYRFVDHVKYLDGFIEALGLTNITLVIHDWGSALGFHYAHRNEGNVKGIAFMEAIVMAIPSWDVFPPDIRPFFETFRDPVAGREQIIGRNAFIERALPGAVLRGLTDAEMEHYRAPYLDPPSREPLFRWPNEIPIEGEPADVAEIVNAYNVWLQQTELPKLLLYVHPGSILLAPLVQWCQASIKNLQCLDLGPGLHFIQEDHPHAIGEALSKWMQTL